MKQRGRQMNALAKHKSEAKGPVSVSILVEDRHWLGQSPDLRPRLRHAARLALKRGRNAPVGPLTILLSDGATLHRLNRDYRGKDKPTNVLSFPAPANPESYLGDIAIAHGVTEREAREARKTFADHATHLAVHGILHLLGYDHGTSAEAKVMEQLEIAILAELGIANPYATRTGTI